jgi:integrase
MAFTLRKKGRYWYARGTVPMRQTDGTIAKIRVEDPTGEESKTRAARVADQRWDYYQEQAYRPKPKSVTFEEAVCNFVETKQPSKRDRQFLSKLLKPLGEKLISEIGQTEVTDAACRLYPGCKASTLHRAVYAPVTTVLRFTGLTPLFKKPKVEKVLKDIPDQEWFEAVLPHCDPQLRAYLLFLTITGRRPTEALEATIDGTNAIIQRTKTGSSIRLAIPTPCLSYLAGRHTGKLFSYGDRHNVYRVLRRACRMAQVPVYGLHAIGRHSAATRLLKGGYSTKFVAEALGWASTRMVDQHYGHLAKDEVAEEAQKVGEAWLREVGKKS